MSSNIITRQISKLRKRWYSAQEAREITYNQQLRNWNIEKWTFKLTEQGKEYSNLTPQEREKFRNNRYKNG